ncbi:MAG: L,D-transpeptidase [Alphaproteobacteria bacterium]|nr:L,D-transpeptidase [Alphaproteobacteria bacterium]
MKLLVKIILSATLAVSFVPNGFAASQIVHVDEVIKSLSQIKAPAKKRYPKVKKVKKVYGPTKENVSFSTTYKPGTLIIKTSERKIYLVGEWGRAIRYGIAVGSTASRQWKGKSYISRKRPNPTWIPTASILRENPKMPRVYKPGPRNPLGMRAMNLGGTPTLRIHGTNAPWSIGKAASHGCYRMRNVDVIDLYNRVDVGTQVIIEA